jgi:hypothetical protein
MAPTYAVGGATLSMPTWITVGPKSYWGKPNDGIKNSNFGVFSTGLKGSVPLKIFKGGGANASLYAQLQYYHLINDHLEAARFILTQSTGRDKVTFGAGVSIGF